MPQQKRGTQKQHRLSLLCGYGGTTTSPRPPFPSQPPPTPHHGKERLAQEQRTRVDPNFGGHGARLALQIHAHAHDAANRGQRRLEGGGAVVAPHAPHRQHVGVVNNRRYVGEVVPLSGWAGRGKVLKVHTLVRASTDWHGLFSSFSGFGATHFFFFSTSRGNVPLSNYGAERPDPVPHRLRIRRLELVHAPFVGGSNQKGVGV